MADDEEIRDFWLKSLFEQLYAVPAHERGQRGYQWRMSPRTLNLLRKILTRTGDYAVPLPLPFDAPELLLGYPIELDESTEGATFVPAEAVCRG